MRSLWIAVLLMLLCAVPAGAQESRRTLPEDDYQRAERLGITFVNSIDTPHAEDRYQHALELGAGWTRWPLYWDRVETDAGEFDWSAYDALVEADTEHGLRSNVILLGVPQFYRDESSIAGLQEPIYADGTDSPGADKTINPDNYWANFVQQAVARYTPGGALALENDWEPERGITVWEVWNEPDYPLFWSGSAAEYARMLKIAYLIIHQLDPDATVMVGGLLYPTQNNWLATLLGIIIDDPQHEANHWYMDAVAVHSYGNAWRSGWLTLYVRQTLIEYEIERPIWLNESGVATWDDYPGPTWFADDPGARATRATAAQQANFLIQSSAYAWAEGAQVVFYHQLYDDCGDQPPGTDFAPDDGINFGDAFGLFRNRADSICFAQHPEPDTARPVARAYQLLAEVFGSARFSRRGVVDERDDGTVTVTFSRPDTDERIIVAWNTTMGAIPLDIESKGTQATRYTLTNHQTIRPFDGHYTLNLPAALTPSQRFTGTGGAIDIGGTPLILVEALPAADAARLESLTFESSAPVQPEPTAAPQIVLSQEEVEELIAASPTGAVFTSLNVSRLRSLPTTDSRTVGNLPPGNSAAIIGKTEDEGWLQVDYNEQLVWVATFLGEVHGDLAVVPIVEVELPAPASPAPIEATAEATAGA